MMITKDIPGTFPISVGEYYSYTEERRQQICVPANSGQRLELRSPDAAQYLINQIKQAAKELGWEGIE